MDGMNAHLHMFFWYIKVNPTSLHFTCLLCCVVTDLAHAVVVVVVAPCDSGCGGKAEGHCGSRTKKKAAVGAVLLVEVAARMLVQTRRRHMGVAAGALSRGVMAGGSRSCVGRPGHQKTPFASPSLPPSPASSGTSSPAGESRYSCASE